jgi:hypothetical protein
MTQDDNDAQLHKESKREFPGLDLIEGEHVIIDVERHWMGRFRIWIGVILGTVVLLAAAAFFYYVDFENADFSDYLAIACVLAAILMPFVGTVFVRDYDEDWLIVTNLRLIENIRHTAFATVNQEIGLDGVEDISSSQVTIFEKMFNYGTIKMSTIGDEHTYKFTYVTNPGEQTRIIRRIVTSFHERHLNGKKK